MEFFEEKLRSIQEMVSSLHAVKMSHMVEEDTLLKKRWAKQAREIAYDTQDFIDLFRHGTGLSLSDDTVPKTTGRLKKLRRFSRRPRKLRLDREMVNKIEELKARMAEVIERHKRFKIGMEPSSPKKEDMSGCSGHQIQSEASASTTFRCPTVSIDAHLSALYGGGDGLVGIDGPRDELTALLMDGKQQMKVVSVLGPEGIGKTTLAKEVYNNMQGRFEYCAFVSMSQKTGIQEILQAFLSQFSAQDGASIEACQEERLTHKLIQLLKGKRYFVVLDGVWSTRAWRLIRCALPGNNLGSRILMTTCIDDIAMSCCSTAADSIYRMKYLPKVEGRRLFMERTFGLEKWCPYWLEEVGSEILRKCGGWPIVILTIARLLASNSSSEEQWKMIEGSIGLAFERPRKKKGLALEQSQAHSCDSLQGVKNILYICYNDLPQHLKTCLLYLSIYPEGYVISRDHLVRRWIAEGFISVRSGHENLEEVGQCYFNELINRGMIHPVGIQYDGRADACQVHNLILSLIVSISAEENFVTLFDGQAHELGITDKVRRLSLNYHGQQHFPVPSTITASPVRSLTLFGSAQGAPILSNSRALRVLDLDVQGDPGKKYLGTVGSFFQLNYLGFQMSGVVELPEQIGELQFLETLDLTKTSIRKLPRSILRLWRLVYLLVCNVELPDGVGDMRSLEELSGIQVSTTNSTNSLLGVGQLTKLRIVQLIWSISDACSDIKGYEDNLVSSLKELSKLQSLCIESKDGSSLSFLDSWSPHPQPLQKLYLTGGYYFPRIPERIISLVNLDFLDIRVYQVEDEMMNVLGSLPALLVLSLSSQVAAPEQMIVVQPGLFHCLRKFTLTCLNSWTGLVIEPEALPKLARLGLLCYVQGRRDPMCADYSIKYLSSIKNLRVEITFGDAGIWEVATRFLKPPTPQVQISDAQHIVKEEAEIIDKVEPLPTHESSEKESAIYKEAKLPQPHEVIHRVHRRAYAETMERFLVSAATGAMTSLLGKLGTMLTDEYKLLKDVRGDIEFLKDELEAMQAFLLVMADVEEPDQQAKLRADAVRELSYDMEDKIDKFMLLVNHESSSKSESFKELFNKSMKKISDIKARDKIAKDVKDIKSKVREISKRYARYKIDEPSMPRNEKVDPQLCAVYKDTSELVGIDTPRDELVKWLSDEEGELTDQLKVVSIVGTGGLGKTTLARQVYNKLGANLDCRAFVTISRSPNMTKILSSILSQLRKQDQDHAEAGDPQLIIDHIREFLKDKRYLIVIDDIWDVPTWKILECAFVKSSRGSRVMSTTRTNDVAKSCCSSQGNLVYKIKPLSDADSAKLFFKRIFGCEERCPSNMKEASEDILKKCGGLPLAINAISSLLATGKTEQEWSQVRSYITSVEGKSSDIEALKYILSLSYFDLPLHLRSCLLYLTMFPEDYEIKRKRLAHRWISEGLIHGKDGEDLVELGYTYFHELVNRSLIQPVNVKYNGKASCCRVHDTVLDFLIYISDKENFCTLSSNKAKLDRRIRRLSLMGNEDEGIIEQLDLSHARSLGVFGSTKQLPFLVKSDALRVLDLKYCSQLGNHDVKDIGRLLQLRYLDIYETGITELPKQIGDLEYLETLSTQQGLFLLPESVSCLKRLARLYVTDGTKFPDGIGNMKNLQKLGVINPSVQSLNFLEGLGELINLRKLRISWYTSKSDSGSASYKEKLVSSLCKLENCNLRNLHITFRLREEDGFIRDLCFPSLNSVRNICFWHGEIRWIAKWLLSLANLQKLNIMDGKIEQQDLEMVGSISTLVKFVSSQCRGPIIILSGRFQRLQSLSLGGLKNSGFNGLMFEAGAVLNLKKLVLCFSLDKFKSSGSGFDFGIQHLASLASIDVSIDCIGVNATDVEAAERALKSMAEANPNCPTLEIRKMVEGNMLPDE